MLKGGDSKEVQTLAMPPMTTVYSDDLVISWNQLVENIVCAKSADSFELILQERPLKAPSLSRTES